MIDLIHKYPEAGQKLIQLYDKQKLYALAKDKRADARLELADLMAEVLGLDLFEKDHELVTDILLDLIHQAELDLRAAISDRLSLMGKAPLRLILSLANDEIEVARPVLTYSPVLNQNDLVYIIHAKNKNYWEVIATRPDLSAAVIEKLAETQDPDTAIALVSNLHIVLTMRTLEIFSDMSQANTSLAERLCLRRELPRHLAQKLYQFVGAEMKDFIAEQYDLETGQMFNAVAQDIILDFISEDERDFHPTSTMMTIADQAQSAQNLTIKILLDHLKRGQISNFMALFSVYCGVSVSLVKEYLLQTNGQGLALCCKAADILKADFVTIYLLTARLRGNQMIQQKDLAKALAYYDKTTKAVAQKILNQKRH